MGIYNRVASHRNIRPRFGTTRLHSRLQGFGGDEREAADFEARQLAVSDPFPHRDAMHADPLGGIAEPVGDLVGDVHGSNPH